MHAHAHHSGGARRRLGATMALTATLMVAELAGGVLSGSLALLADAGHMLTDFLALLVAFAAVTLAQRPADKRRTFGYRRLEILAAMVNGVALVVISGSIAYEAVERWLNPQPIEHTLMAAVATVGLFVNLIGLWLLHKHDENLNMRGAFLHVLGDTLTSVGVLVGAAIIALTGWHQVDAIVSMGIAIVIVITSLALLREVFDVLLESAPRGIDTDSVRSSIASVDGVDEVHDLHVWSITSGLAALSAHVVVRSPDKDHHKILLKIQQHLRDDYHIEHSTLQIEPELYDDCGCC